VVEFVNVLVDGSVVKESVREVVPCVFKNEEESDLHSTGTGRGQHGREREGKKPRSKLTWGTISRKKEGKGTSQVFIPTEVAIGWNK